jgi:DNA polymerase I-like protein with 3'-5' exonuclease and polymerase domains
MMDDFSQIELRILAQISADPGSLKVNGAADLYRKMFEVAPSAVNNEQRRYAKTTHTLTGRGPAK